MANPKKRSCHTMLAIFFRVLHEKGAMLSVFRRLPAQDEAAGRTPTCTG